VLLGRSGSGKTTTLKLVNRLLSPTAGEVRVNGVPNSDSDVIRLRRSIGYVIQDVGLFPHFTVERNIGLVPTIEGWPEERIRSRVQELLQLVGLGPQMSSRYPHQLSGGQRQRVGVARALAADPEVLLIDEPRLVRSTRSRAPNCSASFCRCSKGSIRRWSLSRTIFGRRCCSARVLRSWKQGAWLRCWRPRISCGPPTPGRPLM
jgi:ABC-type uncharacterized transport system YnjBCD ATPase subunit